MKPRADLALVGAAVLAFGVPTLGAIGAQIGFGYDEAVYAQLTRHWLTGAPASGWDLHRPPGLSVLGIVPQLVSTGTEWAQRLIGACAGASVVVAAWWAARRIGGSVAGVVAAVALAASAPLQVESASFLTDVPSTAVLLIIGVLGWHHLSGPPPIGRSVAWLGLLAAAAFYLRYGAVVELVGLAAAAIAIAPRRLLAAWQPVATAVGVFLIALVPHFAISIAETGSPWGILAAGGRAAGTGGGLPLVSYLAWFPWRLIGPVGAALALVGIIAAVRVPAGPAGTFARFAGVALIVPIAVLGTIVHAEPRYLLFPMVLLVIAGSAGAAPYLERSGERPPFRWVAGGLAVAALVLGAATTSSEVRTRAATFDWKREAGREIGTEAGGGRDCSVLTADVPIISWYSGCPAVNFLSGPPGDRTELLTGTHRFIVVRADGHLQPAPAEIDALVAGAQVWRTYDDGSGRPAAVVYRLPEP